MTEIPYSDFIIVGAGTSGSRCALELSRIGSVRVLEADTVLNGRAKSIAQNNAPFAIPYHIDLHSHWHHGGWNPFVEWFCTRYQDRMRAFGIKKWDELFNLDKVDRVFDVTQGQIAPGFRHEGSRLLEEAFVRFDKMHPGKDTSLAHLAHFHADRRLPAHAEFTAATWAGIEGAYNVSAREYSLDPFGSGGYQVVGGMARMQSVIADDARMNGVMYEKDCKVVSAKQNSEGCVFTDDKGREFHSRYGGLSVPIGVLKRNVIDFDRFLPWVESNQTCFLADIARYANSLTMGRMTKVTQALGTEFFERAGIPPNERYDFRDPGLKIFCHAYSAGNPTATIYAGGMPAVKLELMNRKSKSDINDLIKFAFGQIPAFEGFEGYIDAEAHVTDCNFSPFSYGAYSALRPGGQRKDPMIYGRLVFFGEAFVADYNNSPGTLVGANYSGGRAAEILSTGDEKGMLYSPVRGHIERRDQLLSAAAN